MRTSRTKFSRSWHYMPMHEKALVFSQTSLPHTIVFQALASLCTLKTAYKFEKEFRGCRLTTKARNKFLAYVDFANANIFPDKPFRKRVFQRLTENLNADKI